MSRRGIMSNRLYVTIDIPFENAWSDLSSDEQEEFVTSNIDMIDTDALITELEYRGYIVKEEGEIDNE